MAASRLTGPARQYAHGELIHEIVTRQARRQPAAAALVHRGEVVTYAKLDGVANAYATELASRGVGPGDVVPVALPRSPRLVAVLLAVLKCGAAYAALDAGWPRARIETLLRQLRPRVFVTGEPGPDWAVPMWTVTEEGWDAQEAPPPAPVPVDGSAAASVFFTSGTTGTPKGVLSPHRGVTRLFLDCPFAGFGPDSVMPQAAPLPWDGFSLELWSVLLNGGTSVLIEDAYLLPGSLRRSIGEHGVNVVWLTSSLFNLIVDEDLESFAGLRDVLIGGEKLSPGHVRKFLARFGDIRLTNGYGPAESTVFVTTHRVRPEDCDRPDGIPLGTPVPNTSTFVLRDGRLCAPGTVGELHVAGDGLATGYLGDPELTGRRFPELDLDGVVHRLYRTGDLVHQDAGGVLHFHGRADRQVKLRGKRIEPAEIEQAALALPGVRACAATTVAERLVLCHTGGTEDVAGRLRATLPGYLIPDDVVGVPRLPLLPNGKLDHPALAAMITTRPATGAEDAAEGPADPDVQVVRELFAEVLGLGSVPVNASFFASGGSSLSAGRLCARLAARFGVDVPVSRVLRDDTPARLGHWVARARAAGTVRDTEPAAASLVAMQPSFLHAQMFDPDELSGLCLMTWRIEGDLDPGALEAAFGDVVARHEALRARCEIAGTSVILVPDGEATAEFHRPARAAELVPALCRPMDPFSGELCRAALVHGGTGEHHFGIAVHHLVFDGWSEHLLVEDLSVAYAARVAGAVPVFARPAPGLVAVAAEYRRQLAHADLDEQAEFWTNTLSGLPALEFPGGDPSPGSAGRTAVSTFEVPAATTAALARIARKFTATPFVVFFAAFAQALGRVTGQATAGIGVPVARRSSDVLAAAVTCLINTVCVPTDLAEAGDWTVAVPRARLAVQGAFAAQDVPIHEVVALLGAGHGDRRPLFQAMFAYQDNEGPMLDLPGCTAEFTRVDPPQGITELLTEVVPRPDGSAQVRLVHEIERVPADVVGDLAKAYQEILESSLDFTG